MTGSVEPELFPNPIPLFPLPNVVLFPGVGLPLHIFEQRYRTMMEDTVGGDRLIGLVLLRDGWEQDYYGSPPIHGVGCLGEIAAEERLADGRWNLILRGLARFKLVSESGDGKPYRVARVSLLGEPSQQPTTDETSLWAGQLVASVWKLLGQGDEARTTMGKLFGDGVGLAQLTDRIAAATPIPAAAKQRVLETLPAVSRVKVLLGELAEASIFPSTIEDSSRESGPSSNPVPACN